MGLPVEVNNLMMGSLGGYTIGRSLRFRSSASAYLNRTPANTTNTKTWTWSGWVKRGGLAASTYYEIFGAGSTSVSVIYFYNDVFYLQLTDSAGTTIGNISTSAVFRDPSAWYHVIAVLDTTQATGTNRFKLYINGVQQTLTFTTTPSQNADGRINNSSYPHYIGGRSTLYYDGYLAEINFIDGQALTPSSFGAYDTNGVWQPKKYTGTYGTNGFYLPFSDTSSGSNLVKDTSGNNNNWTPNNISASTGGPTSVAAATGALPIYETTDTYGAVKGSGVRADSNASSVVLDIPMGTSSGLDISDQSPSGRTSGTKTLTNNGSIVVNTSISKFYGGSADLTTTGRYFSLANSTDFDMGTGNFTLETWIYPTAGECRLMCGVNPTGECAAIPGSGIYIGISGVGGQVLGGTIVTNKWQHVAFVRIGATIYGYIDGVPCPLTYAIGAATSFSFTTGTGSLIGRNHLSAGTAVYCPAYLQDFRVYKGVAKYTSSFTPPSSTVNSTVAVTYDSMIDSPTVSASSSNYCTWNPNWKDSTLTISDGNLKVSSASNSNGLSTGTIAVSSGKWYWEATIGGSVSLWAVGIIKTSVATPNYTSLTSGSSYAWNNGAQKYNGQTASSYGATYTTGDVLGVALDLDGGTITFYKNNVSQGTAFTGISGTFTPMSLMNASSDVSTNFGQRPFAYTPPTGFNALNTYNLPAPSIANGAQYMAATTYTGTGATQSITNGGNNTLGTTFQPDLIWGKARNSASSNVLTDVLRGVNSQLSSNLTNAQDTQTDVVTAFNSNGFTVGASAGFNMNQSGSTLVAWQWKAGGTGVTNTSGTITSTVSANTTAGFSIVTYTGTGANATVGHGLGVAPSMIIIKNRTLGTENWAVYHTSTGAGNWLLLSGTNAAIANTTIWQNTSPTSSVFSLGPISNTNVSGSNFVAYCFAAVSGYSAFGSYVGSGSADGPFVFTNFRPRFILIKRTDTAGYDWAMMDTSRDTYNVAYQTLWSNLSNAEYTTTGSTGMATDILSNGFKMRGTNTENNASGGTYVWAAFCENPFKYSRGR